VASVNGPSSVVLSGDECAVLDAARYWEEQGRRTKRLRVSHAFHSHHMDAMLGEFGEIAQGVSFDKPRIPIISDVTGHEISAEEICDASYWVRHVREPVRFADGIGCLKDHGVTRFLELGPDGGLCAMAQECASGRSDAAAADDDGHTDILALPLLRKGRPELETLLTSVAGLWVNGVEVDWGAAFRGQGVARVSLPTYAFQRERFWLKADAGVGRVNAIDQTASEHPLLDAALAFAGGEARLFTGRVSLDDHPWLADHSVFGAVLLPGTAFLDLALHVGEEVGCEVVQELTLEAPLVVPDAGEVKLQMFVGEPDDDGRRPLTVHSRLPNAATNGDGGRGREWTRNARGVLADSGRADMESGMLARMAGLADGEWPPDRAEPVGIDDLYDRLGNIGLDYGPVFQGLTAVWRRGGEFFAEVALPQEESSRSAGFGLHPALLDAALHAGALALLDGGDAGDAQNRGSTPVRLPFAWNGVNLLANGAGGLRVRASAVSADGASWPQGTAAPDDVLAPGTVSLLLADQTGAPVASIESLVTRPVSAGELEAAVGAYHESLYQLEWAALADQGPSGGVDEAPSGDAVPAGDRWVVLGPGDARLTEALAQRGAGVAAYSDLRLLREALDSGAPVPDIAIARLVGAAASHAGNDAPDDVIVAGHALAHGALSLVQSWLTDERFTASRLVLITEGAIAATVRDELPSLDLAPVWGLVRSAQTENPGRFVLVDIDGEDSSRAALPAAIALALAAQEPQLAVREGDLFAARRRRPVWIPSAPS
jgi:acyl transferase domain-containing protein